MSLKKLTFCPASSSRPSVTPQSLNLEDGNTWGPWASGSSDSQGDAGALPPRTAGKVGDRL